MAIRVAVKQRKNSIGETAKKAPGKPFQAGQSGNPKGRPPIKLHLGAYLRTELDKPCEENPAITNGEWIAAALVKQAGAGNIKAIKEVFDRTEGKPKQTLEVTTDERRQQLIRRTIEQYMAEQAEYGRRLAEEDAKVELRELVPEFAEYLM